MNPADKVEKWAIDKLIPYARNARTHSDEQVSQIAASIKEWGWTTPVLVDETGSIIANTRVAQTLFQRATEGTGKEAVTACIFWLKCRAGWRDQPVDATLGKKEQRQEAAEAASSAGKFSVRESPKVTVLN